MGRVGGQQWCAKDTNEGRVGERIEGGAVSFGMLKTGLEMVPMDWKKIHMPGNDGGVGLAPLVRSIASY